MDGVSPIDDIKTYRKVADEAYGRKFSTGVQNPVAATAKRMEQAEAESATGAILADPAKNSLPNGSAPAAAIPGVKFTKGFTPAERAAQQAALQRKLASRD